MIPNSFEKWIQEPLEHAWYLTGPTASGKSSLAIALAKKLDAEIISVDSMTVYCGMDIGTAKPTVEQRREIPHHLIDLVEPTTDYSVSQFVIDSHATAKEIRSRGKQVLLVGGTPLYLKTLLLGMFLGPPADWEFRAAVEKDVAEFGVESLRKRLELVDPLSAHRILAGDVRRMTRALEVAKLTGHPLSHWQTQFEKKTIPVTAKAFVLSWDRISLHQRVNDRVDSMFERGLVDEVKQLVETFGQLGRTASQAVGYKEPLLFLEGKLDHATMVEQVKAHTRQFVRRQEIWFRNMPQLARIPVTDDSDVNTIANGMLEDHRSVPPNVS